MNLTAYDTGQRSPAELFPPERRRNVILQNSRGRRTKGLSEEERRLRMVLAVQVREQYASTSAMARDMGIHGGTIKQWLSGVRPVPDHRLESLEKLAGGAR